MIRKFLSNAPFLRLYHWTDVRNLPSVRAHGLLSLIELARRGITPVAPGGNDLSQYLDATHGLDAYVHLCCYTDHPMAYRARQEKRVLQVRYIEVDTSVLLDDGVLFCNDVSVKSGVTPVLFADVCESEPISFLARWNDWKDPDVQARLKEAKRYEILVPHHIDLAKLRGLK